MVQEFADTTDTNDLQYVYLDPFWHEHGQRPSDHPIDQLPVVNLEEAVGEGSH